jgi:hypothetical protein
MNKIHTLYTLDDSGNPVPVDLADPQNAITWGEWRYTHHKECVVAQDPVHDDHGILRYGISTVFTGMNAGLEPPLLWETVITHVGSDDDESYSHYESYASRVEAEVGHQRALAYFRGEITKTGDA